MITANWEPDDREMSEQRFAYHWISRKALQAFHESGTITPYWRHFVLDLRRYVDGISTCFEPMLWEPDEGTPREPCLIIDTHRLKHPLHEIRSSESYHLTRELAETLQEGGDPDVVIERALRTRRFTFSTCDELFIEGPLEWDAVIAIGGGNLGPRMVKEARMVAEARGIAFIDMQGWEVGYPSCMDLDDVVSVAIDESNPYAPTR